ncbi:MAG: hypothetical protein NVSMB46_01200 [Candidatus Saccharimonadales bacterium]
MGIKDRKILITTILWCDIGDKIIFNTINTRLYKIINNKKKGIMSSGIGRFCGLVNERNRTPLINKLNKNSILLYLNFFIIFIIITLSILH